MTCSGCCLGSGGMPLQPKPSCGERGESHLPRQPRLQLHMQAIGMQMHFSRLIAGDSPAKAISFQNLNQALTGWQGAVDDHQFPYFFCVFLCEYLIAKQRQHSAHKPGP